MLLVNYIIIIIKIYFNYNMNSDNLLTNIIDEDNIILKLPSPNIILSIDRSSDINMLEISGNFRMSQEISKIVYNGPSKNTLQLFELSEIYIKFSIHDDTDNKVEYISKYDPTDVISSTCIFIITNKYRLPDNLNLLNLKVDSFKIIANYVYGNNKISSIIRLNNDDNYIKYSINVYTNDTDIQIIEEDKYVNQEDEYENQEEEYENNIENFIGKKVEHLTDNSSTTKSSDHSNPYFTLYWLVPLSVIICAGIYFFKRKKHSYSHSESSESE